MPRKFTSLSRFFGFPVFPSFKSDLSEFERYNLLEGYTLKEAAHIFWNLRSIEVEVAMRAQSQDRDENSETYKSTSIGESYLSGDGKLERSSLRADGMLLQEPCMRGSGRFYITELRGNGAVSTLLSIWGPILDDEAFILPDTDFQTAPIYSYCMTASARCGFRLALNLHSGPPTETNIGSQTVEFFGKEKTFYINSGLGADDLQWSSDMRINCNSYLPEDYA